MRGRRVTALLLVIAFVGWGAPVVADPLSGASIRPESQGPVVGSAPLLVSERPEVDEPARVNSGVSWSASQPAVAPGGEELGELTEVVGERSRTSRVFDSSNGFRVFQEFDTPIHFESTGGWARIENDVETDPVRPGWVASDGNEFKAAFGPAREGIEIQTSAGTVSVVPLVGGEARDSTGEAPSSSGAGLSPTTSGVVPRVEDSASPDLMVR